MPRKASEDHYYWDPAKEKKFLLQLDEYLAYSGGKRPPKTLELWAIQFNAEGWKALQRRSGLGYDPSTDRVYKECNHLRYEGLRNKKLYYNVFEKNHDADASGYGSVAMPADSTPYGDVEASMDYSETRVDLEEDLTPTTGPRPCNNIRSVADAGPSRSRASSGKRKQRDETDEMTFIAMQEIVSHFRGQSQSGQSNQTSIRTNHMLMCMSIMIEMSIPPKQRCQMWHYLDAHPRLQRTFHQLPDVDRREIIASVVESQRPPTD
ncbi:hypothetical protein TIFTF001_041396 [Ficus carica]|uniref:Uncharacterized protein n=1 Tax=Ficus carica TaxID=3494 RepID=A0AA87Z5T0_FICCA|nr:hypothetical protein TIFTF001_041396 [Ficus carica]